MITLTCEQCSKPYETKPYMANKSQKHFCSSACYGDWQKKNRVGVGRKRVSVVCHTCGTEIKKQPSAVKEHNFCNRKCFGAWRASAAWSGENNPAWLGGHDAYRGPNWTEQSRKARARDGNICQSCGIVGEGLPVHHIKPFRLFTDYRDANDLENLVTLCETCHGIAEWNFWREHPELNTLAPFPLASPEIACRACGQNFLPRSGATKVCDSCCNTTCEHCHNPFYSRKAVHRKVKYCSKKCRNDAVRRKPAICKGCGKEFIANRANVMYCCRDCHMTKGNPRRQFFSKRNGVAQESNPSAE